MSNPDSKVHPSSTPPKKRKKLQYKQVYLKKWEETYKWVAPGFTENHAFCKLCKKEINISHSGKYDLQQHSEYKGHKSKEKSISDRKVSSYFVNVNNCDENQAVTAVELGQVYHCVKHNHSYSSLDCGNKLFPSFFSDSKTAIKISCGRTKAEMLVKNILAPASIKEFTSIIRKQFFSLSTDASNKGNRKMFPVCVKYFNPSKGVENKILNFVESPNESASAISGMLLENLQTFSLDLKHVSSYGADNANVNYGKNHSVYQLLKEKNKNIVKANCTNHILHNSVKYAADRLDIDVENLVLKIYNHFSSSAKQREELKSFFEFVELEWTEILRHVPTRWLSLTPAVIRLTENWAAITSYFKSIDDCPKYFSSMFGEENDKENLMLLYLSFFANIGQQINISAKLLEKQDLSILESFKIMNSLKNKIELRIKDQYFGNAAKQLIQSMNDHSRKKITTDLCHFYENVLKYLNKWYDFTENNIYLQLKNFSLFSDIEYSDFEKAVNIFGLQDLINLDVLYEEFCDNRSTLCECIKIEGYDISKWLHFFSKVPADSVPNIFKVISFLFSIPGSNAFVERVFSLMQNKWTDVRNRCLPELIKAELQIVVNFDMSCKEFYESVKKNKKLLDDAKSKAKYIC